MVDSSAKSLHVQELLDAGLHFGHQTKRWNPKMKRYIHGSKNGIYIIDLNKTLSQLELAKTFLKETVLRGEKCSLLEQKNKLVSYLKKPRQKPISLTLFIDGLVECLRTIRPFVVQWLVCAIFRKWKRTVQCQNFQKRSICSSPRTK